jgi:FkbM family methyltransferase
MKLTRSLRRAFLSGLKILDRIVVGAAKTLPLFLQASIKEGLEPLGHLDFDGANITLSVNSKLELKRLFPCREEPGTCAWIRRQMKLEDVFYDIGANAGSYSFIAYATARGNCAIVAFEPNPFTFASLSKNILINGSAREFTALNMALSDKTRVTSFLYSTLRSGSASHRVLCEGEDAEVPGAFQRILAMRLDDAVSRFALPRPSHIKIDVDGAELEVLHGAPETLEYPGLNSLLIEIDENKNSHPEVFALMQKHGFTLVEKHTVHRPSNKIFNCVFERGQ